jgi:hypothetical protein
MSMKLFLFRFGFCTPGQWLANAKHGWDDESSEAIFIKSDSAEAAESWGCEIAERYCSQLYAHSKEWAGEIPSWRAENFAFWIEQEIGTFPEEYLKRIPVVESGELPCFELWLRK